MAAAAASATIQVDPPAAVVEKAAEGEQVVLAAVLVAVPAVLGAAVPAELAIEIQAQQDRPAAALAAEVVVASAVGLAVLAE